ncbi:hypothetical protein [Meiothermus sp.]|uniref:hypothetical protein n=1 Tax=Meiothermus sp. TaxID=1955249 RepID=UPI0021DCF0BC|nr:hypothetical protein [Meiothermus sp.]GIW33385.1 MAG: hypothetical protein KatS3mg072_0718 [Meiothermus sp.]
MATSVSGLSQRLASALEPVFGRSPTLISDSPELVEWLADQGCESVLLEVGAVERLSKRHRQNVLMIPATDQAFSFHVLDRAFRGSRVLIVPVIAFDPALEAAQYTVEMVSRSDFAAAVAQNRAWLDLVQYAAEPLVFEGPAGRLECGIKERVQLMKPRTQTMLLPGEWEAIGMYFEVPMIPDNEDFFHPGYIVNGQLEVCGAAVARHRQMPAPLVPLHAEAWELMSGLLAEGRFPLKVEVKDSRLVGATAGGRDITPELLRLSNEKLELLLIEFAFSNNPSLKAGMLDWSVNSVMNEGIQGLHIAVGDGLTGAHIDLICADLELTSHDLGAAG